MEKPTPDGGASIQDSDLLTQNEPGETVLPTEDAPGDEGIFSQETGEPEGGATDESTLTTADLAQYFGVEEDALDVDEDGSVVVRTKVDGKEGKAKLADVLKSYQVQGHLDNKSREVKQREQQLEQQLTQAQEQTKQRLDQLDNGIGVAQQQLMQDAQRIDWNALRQEDPAEFAAKAAEFQQRRDALTQQFQYIQAQRQQALSAEQAKEVQRLPSVIPEWTDQNVASKEKAEVSAYMQETGINPAIANYADGIAVMRKAMLYDRLQKSKPEVQKLVRNAPKVSRPGTKGKQTPQPQSIEDVFYGT